MAAIPQKSKAEWKPGNISIISTHTFLLFPSPLSTSQNGFLKEKRKLHFYSIHKFLYSKRFLRRKNRDRQCIFFQYFRCSFSSKIRVRSSTSARVKILSIKAGGSAIVGGASSQGRDYRKLFCLCCSKGNFFSCSEHAIFLNDETRGGSL